MKKKWEKPTIKELGKAKEIIRGGQPADPKFLGSGDQFTDSLTT